MTLAPLHGLHVAQSGHTKWMYDRIGEQQEEDGCASGHVNCGPLSGAFFDVGDALKCSVNHSVVCH